MEKNVGVFYNVYDTNQAISEMRFLELIVSLLTEHPDYDNVVINYKIGKKNQIRFVDLSADLIKGEETRKVLVEIKGYYSITKSRLEATVKHIDNIRKEVPGAKFVIAMSGIIDNKIKEYLSERDIDIWDINSLYELFAVEIQKLSPENKDYLDNIRETAERKSRADELISKLKKLPLQKGLWMDYQKLCQEIFEYLFSPPLGKPMAEASDYQNANRRDIIMANYAESGFWHYMRQEYRAPFIVADAKNWSVRFGKNQVLQMANYLKRPGLGHFGIIISRIGGARSAIICQRDKWIIDNKLIIFLQDEDLIAMLELRKLKKDPSTVIRQIIEDFRIKV